MGCPLPSWLEGLGERHKLPQRGPEQNNHAKFHPDQIQNDGALRLFKEPHPNKNKNKISSDIESVPDLKTVQ